MRKPFIVTSVLAGVVLIMSTVCLAIFMPVISPNVTFAHSPFFGQVLDAYVRGGWDFDGGWRRVDARFPNAVSILEERWSEEGGSDAIRRAYMKMAGTMFVEGFQIKDGMRLITRGIKSPDIKIREEALYSLCYGAGRMGWREKEIVAFLQDQGAYNDETSKIIDIAIGPPKSKAP